MDVLGTYLQSETVKMRGEKLPCSALYLNYKVWCQACGEDELTERHFRSQMRERGYSTKRNAPNGANAYQDIAIRANLSGTELGDAAASVRQTADCEPSEPSTEATEVNSLPPTHTKEAKQSWLTNI